MVSSEGWFPLKRDAKNIVTKAPHLYIPVTYKYIQMRAVINYLQLFISIRVKEQHAMARGY